MGLPTIRPVVPADIPGIAEISRNTWDGEDYLLSVADSWIAEGGFMAGEIDGTIFGCYKITLMPGGVAWLEGLRVLPSFRGRGLGRMLAEDSFEKAAGSRRSGLIGSIEFETYYHNVESIAIAVSRGFEPVEKFSLLFRNAIADSGPQDSRPAVLCGEDLAPYALRVPLGWKVIHRTPRILEDLAVRSSAVECSGLRFFSRPGDNVFTLCSSSLADPAAAGRAAARFAAASGSDTAELMIPGTMTDVVAALLSDGWGYWEEPAEPNAWIFRMR